MKRPPSFVMLRFDYESQANQNPRRGKPGITRATYKIDKFEVEALLHYRKTGDLTGLLYYYPQEIEGLQNEGSFNIFVDPKWRGHGVGTKLMLKACELWKVDFENQLYTKAGWDFIQALAKKKLI